MKINKINYKDINAVQLDNDYLRIITIPEYGSKIASIIYKPLKYELLWQNVGKTYIHSSYGDIFESGEFSGFDEMFPTISRCYYGKHPWQGIEIPDHGEVWSIPWHYSIENKKNYLKLWVNGIRFPYTMEKKITLDNRNLKIFYTVENRSSFTFDFIWAAHPLFNTSSQMRIIVPYGMNKIINSVSGPTLPDYGIVYGFPMSKLGNGKVINIDHIPEKNSRGYQKYYFLGKVTEGWCKLLDEKEKISITLKFPGDKVSYLGMWVNEGGWNGQYNVAPEPSTGAMDRVDFSKIWGMNSFLKPYERFEWFLEISVNEL